MKKIFQIQNEITANERLSVSELSCILGGKRRDKRPKARKLFQVDAFALQAQPVDDIPNATEDDKRRQRPGGGSTTTSPSNFY